MKKFSSVIMSIIVLGSVIVGNCVSTYAKDMPKNAIPTEVKIENNEFKQGYRIRQSRIDELDGFIVDGFTYVKGRDLADVVDHFSFSWNGKTNKIELVDERNNVKFFTNTDLENMGALQYNGENYFKVRDLLELGLINPKVTYDSKNKIIHYNEQSTVNETLKNTKGKFNEIENSGLSDASKKQMYQAMYKDLEGLFSMYAPESSNGYTKKELYNLGEQAFKKKYAYELDEVRQLMKTDKLLAGDKLFEYRFQFYDDDTPIVNALIEEHKKLNNELEEYMPVALAQYEYMYSDKVTGGEIVGSGLIGSPYLTYIKPGDVVYIDIGGKFKKMVGFVAMMDGNSSNAKIYGDGKLLYTVTKEGEEVDIDLTGIKKLKFENLTSDYIYLGDVILRRY